MLYLLFNRSLCTICITLVKIHSFWKREACMYYMLCTPCHLGHRLILLKLWENLQFKLFKLKLHLYLPADILQLSSDHPACGNQSGGERPVHS